MASAPTKTIAHHKKDIHDAINALLTSHGLSVTALHHYLDETITAVQDSRSSLSTHEREALRRSGSDGVVMEKLVADGMVAKGTLKRDNTYKSVCYNKRHSSDPGLLALRSLKDISELKKMKEVFLKPMSEHAIGADAFWISDINEDIRCIEFVVAQIKFGKTPLHDAKESASKTNANRSMLSIANKIRHVADSFTKALRETFPDYTVVVTKMLISGSPLRNCAVSRATKHNIMVCDTTFLWNNIWSDEVKSFLQQEFGPRAHTLGI